MKTTDPIYNGYSIRYIISHFPKGMIKDHKKDYIKNCIEIYKNEISGYNLDYCNSMRNYNFNMIKFYLCLNKNKTN